MNPMGAAVSVRPMATADLDRVLEMAKNIDHAPKWAKGGYVEALNSEARPSRVALVAEDSDASLVGFAIVSLIPPQAELESIAVVAEQQRRGIARQLFFALVAELKSRQVTQVLLEVRASNQPARRFYAALGFEQTGCRPRYYADPAEDAVLMHLSLA